MPCAIRCFVFSANNCWSLFSPAVTSIPPGNNCCANIPTSVPRLKMSCFSFDKEASELLFTYLSLRAGRKSTIITTNLSFERWEEIFKDPVMTAAMIDRLTHKSFIVNMNGNSYRLKETKLWLSEQ